MNDGEYTPAVSDKQDPHLEKRAASQSYVPDSGYRLGDRSRGVHHDALWGCKEAG